MQRIQQICYHGGLPLIWCSASLCTIESRNWIAEALLAAAADELPALTDRNLAHRPRIQRFYTETLSRLAGLFVCH